jgi:hypothetical protein
MQKEDFFVPGCSTLPNSRCVAHFNQSKGMGQGL